MIKFISQNCLFLNHSLVHCSCSDTIEGRNLNSCIWEGKMVMKEQIIKGNSIGFSLYKIL